MSKEQALYQSLAACGAAVIAFIGICHEAVGQTLFPWGPSLFGGLIPWHTLGILTIVLGLALLAGVLRLIEFPLVIFAIIFVVAGLAIAVFTAIVYRQFHMFAFAIAACGAITAFFHRKAKAIGDF